MACKYYIDGLTLSKEGFLSYVKEKMSLEDVQTIFEEGISLGSVPQLQAPPSAPFVTDTNAWVKLGLKVALKEAVAQKASAIAWTTGEQQNDRYDLSKQVDRIEATKVTKQAATSDGYGEKPYEGEPKYNITVHKKGGGEETLSLKENELEANLGKDLAEKIIKDGGGDYSGLDLKVGGKGMKGFYGSPGEGKLGIVGEVAKSLFKQEPKTTEIPNGTGRFDEKDFSDWMAENRPDDFNGYEDAAAEFYNESENYQAYKKVAGNAVMQQHSIAITPELIASVKSGLPLFKDALSVAKDKFREASEALSKRNKNLGIAPDPKEDARALYTYHKALVNLAKEYIKDGIRSVQAFADALGKQLDQQIRDAWNEASGGPERTQKDFLNRALYPAPPPPEITKTKEPFLAGLRKTAFNIKEMWLTYRKGLPRAIWKEKEETIGQIAAQIDKAKNTATTLDKQIAKSKVDIDLVDAALRGDLDALTQLPQDMQQTVMQMRAHIDTLSQFLIDNGLVSEGRQKIISGNIGEYLNRSYRIFQQSDWTLANVPQELYNKAAQFLYKEYYPDIKAQMPTAPDAEVDAAVQQQVKAKINEYFNKGENAFVGNKKIGSKDLSILKKRRDVPPELRALFGEVTDPVNNYVQTIFKLANLAGNANFLTKVKQANMGTLFFEEGDPRRPETHHVKIAAEGSDTMSPLNGLYTTPELAEAFKEQSQTVGEWAQLYLRLTGLVKAGKTVGSVITHLKNVEGNIGIALMNGHLDPTKLAESYKVTRDDFMKADTKRNQDIVQKLIKAGVLNQNIFASEIREMFDKNKSSEAFYARSSGRNRNLWGKTKFHVAKTANTITKLYEAEDNFFKVNAYLQDRERYAKAEYNKNYDALTEAEQGKIDTQVTELIKDTYPTYSRVPRIAKAGSSLGFPLLGNFVAFASESYRVLKNATAQAYKETTSKNPKIRAIGARRLAGMAMYTGLKYALLTAVGKAGLAGLAGLAFDDEEERENHASAIRFVAPWSRNSDLIVLQADKGRLKYIDLSSYDPFGNQSAIINSLAKGEPGSAAWELIQPFADMDLTAKAINSMLNNRDQYDRPIYEDADDPEVKTEKLLKFAIRALEPGTFSTIRRLQDKEDPSKEFGAFVYRTYDIDVAQGFSYKVKDYKEELISIGNTYRNVYYDKETTQKQKDEALAKANRKADDLFKTINQDYKAALDLGVSAAFLRDIMKDRSFNVKIRDALRSGKQPTGIVKRKPVLAE